MRRASEVIEGAAPPHPPLRPRPTVRGRGKQGEAVLKGLVGCAGSSTSAVHVLVFSRRSTSGLFSEPVLGILLSKLCSGCNCPNRIREHEMINPEDEVFVDLSTSCSQDVAVMKLLGWSRGPILRRKILVTEDGISEDQMPFIPLSKVSLAEQLMEIRAVACKELIIAAENNEPHDVLEARENAVQRYDDLIRRAHEFSLDITESLNGDGAPGLILDQLRSQADGAPYITLRSLDRWAKAKYGTSVSGSAPRPTRTDESQSLNAKVSAAENPDPSGIGNSDSLAVTFAFLAEAYAKKHPKELLRPDQTINVAAFSKELAEIISASTQRKPPRGQGDEAIRKRLAESMSIKSRKLQSR